MTVDPDHRLVSELVSLVNDPAAGKSPAARKRMSPATRRIIDIVAWSGVTNLFLFGCFALGWNFNQVSRILHGKPAAVAVTAKLDDPTALSRYELADNELLTHGPQRQLKGPLQVTLVPSTAPAVVVEPASAPIASADDAAAEPDQGDGNGEMTVGPEDPSFKSKVPMLRKGQTAGDIEIGSFATVSLPGTSSDCLDTAYGLLEDVGASRDRLFVLAESKAITVARICATNGSLVVTCRSDQITISPRRLKPNESCTG